MLCSILLVLLLLAFVPELVVVPGTSLCAVCTTGVGACVCAGDVCAYAVFGCNSICGGLDKRVVDDVVDNMRYVIHDMIWGHKAHGRRTRLSTVQGYVDL